MIPSRTKYPLAMASSQMFTKSDKGLNNSTQKEQLQVQSSMKMTNT